MAFFMRMFKSKPVAPERVATDIVIPLHSMDDSATNRAIIVCFSMRFDDRLEVPKLVGALNRLLEKPGWRKLGARLRLNEHDKLEYHVPAQYSDDRPAVRFTHVTHELSISDHPLASELPRPSGSFEITANLHKYRPVLFGPQHPTKIDDWIYTDRPQLTLHVVSFEDATLVTISWLHTLLDAMGRRALLTAWTAMLEGRESDVPEIYGYDIDPLAGFGKTNETEKEEESILAPKVLKGWAMFRFVLNYIWEIMLYSEEIHQICIPPSYVKRLRKEALDDLKSQSSDDIIMDTSDPAAPKPFLSDGDILSAWCMRLLTSCQPWASRADRNNTVLYMNPFGLRQSLESTEPQLLPKGKAYVSNCVMAIFSFFTLSEVLSAPIGLLAARIRKDLTIQGQRPQLDAFARLNKAAVAATGRNVVIGTPDMAMVVFSNWTKGKMFETDFSAAVIKEGTVQHPRGRPTYIQVDGGANGISLRNAGPIIGKDWQGNYWMGVTARPQTWKNMMKAIEGME